MYVTSPAFLNKEMIPSKYTCDGENISPPLRITNISNGTKSIAIINDDPDAPNGDWVHWVVWNIDPNTFDIIENCVMEGAVEGLNSFGNNNYGGPCPSSGKHNYHFKVYALDRLIELDNTKGKKDLLNEMKGHILSEAALIGKYILR